MRRVGLAHAALPFVSVGLAFGLEVTGLVRSGQGGVHGAAVTFVNERDPNEVYSDTTDRDGRYRLEIDVSDVATAIEKEDSARPARCQLNQNYPNPFNPGTVISYELPIDVPVQVDVYNSLGQHVRSLVNGSWQQAGAHSEVWDGRDDDGLAIGAGVYLYRITAGEFEAARKMVLIDGSYRISLDGLHWVTAPVGDTGARRVFFDPLDPDPERRCKSFHPDQLAVSPDGINWTVLSVTIPDASDESNFSLDLENRLYVATIKRSGPYGRSVYLTTSEDFENWRTPELMFHADEEDQELGHERITSRLADPTRLTPIPDHPPDYTVDVYDMGTFRCEGLYIGIAAMHHRHRAVAFLPARRGALCVLERVTVVTFAAAAWSSPNRARRPTLTELVQ